MLLCRVCALSIETSSPYTCVAAADISLGSVSRTDEIKALAACHARSQYVGASAAVSALGHLVFCVGCIVQKAGESRAKLRRDSFASTAC